MMVYKYLAGLKPPGVLLLHRGAVHPGAPSPPSSAPPPSDPVSERQGLQTAWYVPLKNCLLSPQQICRAVLEIVSKSPLRGQGCPGGGGCLQTDRACPRLRVQPSPCGPG